MVKRSTTRVIQRMFYLMIVLFLVMLVSRLRKIGQPTETLTVVEPGDGGGSGSSKDPLEASKGDGSNSRSNAVRQAFLHSFVDGYMGHAFPSDELRPVSNVTNDSWGGMGVTAFDALDSALLMGLEAPLIERLVQHVSSVDFRGSAWKASLFEASIRYLGGLQGAHTLSGDPRLLEAIGRLKAVMRPAFDGESLPRGIVDFSTGANSAAGWLHGQVVLSECCSIQLEWGQESMYVYGLLEGAGSALDGLYPALLRADGSASSGSALYTFGGLGDSFYEVLLKTWILRGKPADDLAHRMYRRCIAGLRKHLLGATGAGDAWVGELSGGSLLAEMDHLLCMLPGVLALGSMHDPEGSQGDMQLAERLLVTCRKLYTSSASGFGPERASFARGKEFTAVKSSYLLRPEYIESLYVLYRVTGEERYREWAWDVFTSIETHCRTPLSYSGLSDVRDTDSQNDSVQSFFFAETLKYLYLIFLDTDPLPLDEYVFTTEAHPLRIQHN